MATQLLIYDQVEVVNRERHREWSVKAGNTFEFARGVNSVPLMAVEFPNAAGEYPIVFAGSDTEVIPVVVMGIRDKENLYIDEEGKWQAKYVPAFIRRYPFVFSSSDDGSTLTLCIDENFEGCNQDGRGERLFDVDGNQTQYLTNVLEFLKHYQASFQQTVQFCKKLKELDILEQMEATFTPPGGKPTVLSGFFAVNRAKLKALPDEKLAELAKSDEMELLYTHLVSMSNFRGMPERLGETGTNETADSAAKSDATEAPAAEAEAVASDTKTSKKKGKAKTEDAEMAATASEE